MTYYKFVDDDDKEEDIIIVDKQGNRIKVINFPEDIQKNSLLKQIWDDGYEDGYNEALS